MGDSVDDFVRSIREFNEKAEAEATKRLRRVSLKALETIVTGTPVLTGCCRANWQIGIGKLQRNYNAKKLDKSGGATINQGLGHIARAKLGVDVFIENSCPYVIPLENGWSRQKPAGSMIRLPLERLQKAVNSGAR